MPAPRDQHDKSRDPVTDVVRKLWDATLTCAHQAIYDLLDPATAELDTPMGLFRGRPNVTAWVLFDGRVMTKFLRHLETDGPVTEGDGTSRRATHCWRIGPVEFRDYVELNQIFQVARITRRLTRLPVPTLAAQRLQQEVLLEWTGPQFVKFCSPKGRGTIDNHAVTLPVLNFGFCGLSTPDQLLTVRPREGTPILDKAVVQHFIFTPERKAVDRAKEAAAKKDEWAGLNVGQPNNSKNEVTIRAKNRKGEQNAIIIDTNALGANTADSHADAIMDAEAAVADSAVRYAACGIKLANNDLTTTARLPSVLRCVVFNAFYFLNWVDLSRNSISDVPDLSAFPISVLYLHDNRIESTEALAPILKLQYLTTLTLFGNALQSRAQSSKEYKLTVLQTLIGGRPDAPLKTFDHSVISEADRRDLVRFGAMKQPARRRQH